MATPSRGDAQPGPAAEHGEVEVSFVMPCLNEAETIQRCVAAAFKCIADHQLAGEVIVADNGSTDGSQGLARTAGARVIDVPIRGVGAAIMAGVQAARGRYIIMGDSDLQHDFAACYPFIEKLREARWDLVMGTRLKGRIMPGSMRTLNRYLGNPALSLVGRVFFRAPVSDFHCGLRAFTRETFRSLNLRTTGFEFTTEHIAKSALRRFRITEIPITVYPEGRSRAPHLRPFNDGWRTLRFMLLLSPRWTLAIPGLILMLIGTILAGLVALHATEIAGLRLDVHTLILGCLLIMVGFTAFSIGAAARIYAIQQELGPPAAYAQRIFSIFTLERGIIAGAVLVLIGVVFVGRLSYAALTRGLHPDEVFTTLRPMIIGSTLIALGAQMIMMSFFYSMLGVPQRRPRSPVGQDNGA